MATPAPAPPAPPVGPDTLVTVKVLYNDTTRRFKIPLRDLGARMFPDKLRLVLSIPNESDAIFERYSDSAASYIVLDSNNPSVYKQLYRAAKAKLKLRIRVTTVIPPSAPEAAPAPVANSPQEAVAPELSQRYSYLDTVLSPPLPAPIRIDTMSSLGSPTLEMPAEAIPIHAAGNLESGAPTDDSQSQPRYRLFTLGQDKPTYPLVFPCNEAPNAAFCIDCNVCGGSIPGEHYHCSICDDGDFDLCLNCIDTGVSCHNDTHWLIKRMVKNGIVTNSTTETMVPCKAAAEPEASKQKIPELVQPVEPVSTLQSESEPTEQVDERTCNACFREFDETKMVSCNDCADYDLCLTCLLKDAHGHHPAHSFSLIHDRQFCLKNLVLSRCRPGRHHHHAATCDGCDKRIVGVRHKCLACPDWDFCWSCIKMASQTHPGHRFVPIYDAISEPIPSQETHYGIFCDGPLCEHLGTSTYITGVRYKCAVCHDTDFCAACEALPINTHNRTHPLIKFRTPVRSVSVSTFGDDGISGPMVMGDRPASILRPTASSSSNTIVVDEKQAEDEVKAEEPSKPDHAEPELKVEEAVPEMPDSVDDAPIKEEPKETLDPTIVPRYDAFFLRDTIHDGTKLPPNHVFQQTWTLYNPGPLTWPAGCSVRYVGGDAMFDLDLNSPSSVDAIASAMSSNELTAPVAPGEQVEFTINLKTKPQGGTLISYWRLKLADGTPFGHRLWCDVHVEKEIAKELPALLPAKEHKLSESNMIFPKLEKESPSSSAHEAMSEAAAAPAAPSAPSLSNASEQDVLEDVESLALEDVQSDNEDFLTDEEYDILDASDQEFPPTKA